MTPILVSSGEPAGIGPDICLALAQAPYPVVVLGDIDVLAQRAKQLNYSIILEEYYLGKTISFKKNILHVYAFPIRFPVIPGILNVRNAPYVVELLDFAVGEVKKGYFSALVTAPIHKGIINQAGMPFTGHTEFLAASCKVNKVVMMLACKALRVALVTTHLPLRAVPDAINETEIIETIQIVHEFLKKYLRILEPSIWVAGLNPHAGEDGYLGREELDIIRPALTHLQNQHINAHGPYAADTLFSKENLTKADAFVAMYHDQGLPILKYAGFGEAVNLTLGLPFIRTSVDHGTALSLAATGKAQVTSLIEAVQMASRLVQQSKIYDN